MSDLKVLVVHHLFSPYGGGEVIAYNTYKILKERGINAYFFSTDKKPYFEEDYEYAKYFYKPQEKKKGLINYIKRISSVYYNKDTAKQFAKMLDDIKPDIVHCHTLYGLTYSILKPCFDRNIPVVKTEHSADIICPAESLFFQNKTYCTKHLCARGNYLHCVKNKCAKNNFYDSLISSIFHTVNDLTGYNNKISRFITPSIALKKAIEQKEINAEKIEVINNFVSDKFVNLTPNYTNNGYFLYTGRLYKFKGVQTLIDAIIKLPHNIEFHIAGTGEEENQLKDICKKNNLDNVKFLGFLDQDELIEEYKNCIALIVPSICFEIFGVVAIEAFACGKPVIASNIGGLGDIIEHKKTGLLFEPGDSDKLAKQILYMYQNSDSTINMGRAAKETVLEQYTEQKYYERLINLYDDIISESK